MKKKICASYKQYKFTEGIALFLDSFTVVQAGLELGMIFLALTPQILGFQMLAKKLFFFKTRTELGTYITLVQSRAVLEERYTHRIVRSPK